MPRYITTTIPYVNANPHIGNIVEFVQADVLARAWRAQGEEVFFTTGTDEHGQKIYEAAQKEGEDTYTYVNRYVNQVKKIKEILNLSYDAFIRTTDEKHIRAAQEMWRRVEAKGDIEKKTYTGNYCVGCEEFKTERDLEGDLCPIHQKKVIPMTEENYFFKLSRYAKELEEMLTDSSRVTPDFRRNELLSFVRSGLEDVSISRRKEIMPWGIPVPGDDAHVMYVWFDALTNYISTLGWPDDREGNFQKFWVEGKTLQLAGKDQLRFQSLIWQGMLLSANIKTTDTIFYHGFLNINGTRISKTIGNVILPHEMQERYGTDAMRYLLLRHVHPTDDTDVSWEKFDEWYTANLVNGVGNLVARVMKLSEQYLDTPIFIREQPSSSKETSLHSFGFNEVLDDVWKRIGHADEKMTKEEPFKVIKIDLEKGKTIITELVHELHSIAHLLGAYMPETSEKILEAIRKNKKPENLFPRLP